MLQVAYLGTWDAKEEQTWLFRRSLFVVEEAVVEQRYTTGSDEANGLDCRDLWSLTEPHSGI